MIKPPDDVIDFAKLVIEAVDIWPEDKRINIEGEYTLALGKFMDKRHATITTYQNGGLSWSIEL